MRLQDAFNAVAAERLRLRLRPAMDGARDTEFRLLGTVEAVIGRRSIALGGAKQRALLAALLLEANDVVSTGRLAEALWGEDAPASAPKTLQVHVSRLRHELEGGAARIITQAPGYAILVAPDAIDVLRFRQIVAEAREVLADGRPAEASDQLCAALALWRGPALADLELEPVARFAAPRLEEERLAALEDRIDADLACGRAGELVAELRGLVDAHPLRERLRAQQMLALYRTGRQADALAAFQDARRRLVSDVGIEPGASLQHLQRQVLDQDPALLLPETQRHRRTRRATTLLAGAAACAVVAGVVIGAIGGDDAKPPAAAAAPPIHVVADSLVGIDATSGRLVSQYQVGANPDQLAVDRDVAWVANTFDNTLSHVDLTTGHRQDVKGFPKVDHVTTTPSGDVFVSSFKHFVWTVSEGSLVPQRILRLPGQAEALAFGAGSLWVSSPAAKRGQGPDLVLRYDNRTARVADRIRVGATPIFTTFGFGKLWVSNYDGDSVSVITPGRRTAKTIPLGDGPLGIASGEGAVWVVLYGERRLLRLDPLTGKVAARIPVGDGPLSVAAAEGSVWVTNREDGTVTQVDPDTNRVRRTIDVQMPPYGVAASGGKAWVTIQASAYPG
jgi:YVTN family beta-propeller protein